MIHFALQILLLLITSALGLLILAYRKSNYWRKRGIPGPMPALVKGNLASLFGNRPGIFQMREWTREYGPFYGIQFGWSNGLVISDPKMVHQVLIDKFEYFHGRLISPGDGDTDKNPEVNMFSAKGKRWKRIRSISNPSFSVANLKRVMPQMADSARAACGFLEKASLEGKPVNLHPYFIELACDVICRVAFGQKESRQFRNELSLLTVEAMERVNNNIFDYFCWIFPWIAPRLIRPYQKLTGVLRKEPFELALAKLAETVKERKRQRDQGIVSEQTDFIDIFLESENDKCTLEAQNGCFNKADTKFERKLLMQEIITNCLLFLAAGFDTTANTLTIMCHNLACYPEVQEKMRNEIEANCVDEDPTFEQFGVLKYTEAVIRESLRLCPIAASVVTRVAQEDTTLGDVRVEKGTAIFTDLFTLHRNKELWGEDADEFRPERWLEEGAVTQSAFTAFGGGPRICIGMRFAILEEKISLCHLLRKFVIRKCEKTEEELDLYGQIVLNPRSVTVRLEPRLEE